MTERDQAPHGRVHVRVGGQRVPAQHHRPRPPAQPAHPAGQPACTGHHKTLFRVKANVRMGGQRVPAQHHRPRPPAQPAHPAGQPACTGMKPFRWVSAVHIPWRCTCVIECMCGNILSALADWNMTKLPFYHPGTSKEAAHPAACWPEASRRRMAARTVARLPGCPRRASPASPHSARTAAPTRPCCKTLGIQDHASRGVQQHHCRMQHCPRKT